MARATKADSSVPMSLKKLSMRARSAGYLSTLDGGALERGMRKPGNWMEGGWLGGLGGIKSGRKSR